MGIRDTLFAIITFVIMVYNGVIMETRFADGAIIIAYNRNPLPYVVRAYGSSS